MTGCEPPAVPEPPPLRSGFISYAEAREIVALHPRSGSRVCEATSRCTTYAAGGRTIAEMVEAADPTIQAGLKREQILNYLSEEELRAWSAGGAAGLESFLAMPARRAHP
jgi:hypothetical protein